MEQLKFQGAILLCRFCSVANGTQCIVGAIARNEYFFIAVLP